MKLLRFALLACALAGVQDLAQSQTQYPFQNPALPEEQRIQDLLSRLTAQEKLDLMGMTLNVPRLGIHASGAVPTIPGSDGQYEGLHGVAIGGPAAWGRRSPGGAGEHGGISTIPTTQFPQAYGLGATWDPALLVKVAQVEGVEARYVFQTWDRGGLILRAPNADLARDPRWGRTEESFGEDPFLTGAMAAAYVRGLQGDDPRTWLSCSLVKHFMANSNENNRAASSSNFDERLMREYYSAPFRMALEQAHAGALMASYNAVNGVPMTANPLLKSLTDSWGFDGMIDTDRGALTYMVTKHHYYSDLVQSVAGAIHAGVNQFLNPYEDALKTALSQNLVSPKEIDRNLSGVLRVLLRLGELDGTGASKYSDIKAGKMAVPWDSAETKNLVLAATRESVVLLKNSAEQAKAPLLPIDTAQLKSIAVVGPRADEVQGDFYGGTPPFAISPLDGIKSKLGDKVAIRFSADHDQAVEMARTSDMAIVVIGNNPTCGQKFGQCSNPTEGKEAIDRSKISLDPQQEKLVEDVFAANPRTVVVLISGFPFTIDWAETHIPAIVYMAHSSEEEGAGLADVLFGDYNPAGRLTQTWVNSIDQLPQMMDYDIRHGRTYMYMQQKPLYAFGFGLSYTRFAYSNLKLSSNTLRAGREVKVSVDVKNTGTRDGDEVVQLYVSHEHSKVARPIEELKGFERVHLAAGETKAVVLSLPASLLAYWDVSAHKWALEADQVEVRVGASSDDIRAKHTIKVAP